MHLAIMGGAYALDRQALGPRHFEAFEDGRQIILQPAGTASNTQQRRAQFVGHGSHRGSDGREFLPRDQLGLVVENAAPEKRKQIGRHQLAQRLGLFAHVTTDRNIDQAGGRRTDQRHEHDHQPVEHQQYQK